MLMVGPPATHKNIAPVATALARRGVDVVVVGGPGAQRVLGFGTEPVGPGPTDEYAGAVTRVGRISDGQMSWLYRHASALVFPSLYEGFGLPVVEAQRLGCPVVASDRASLPEVAGAGALLVDPTDPDEVARQVATLLADPSQLDRLRVRGTENAARFRWDISAARVAEMLISLGPARWADRRSRQR